MLNLSKLVPALAAGNTVVLKAAPDTPWSATWIGKHRGRGDRPPGRRAERRHVARPGRGRRDADRRPARRHDQLHRLDRGREAHHGALRADTLKRVFLELGGKSANIVLDDADLSAVLPGAAMICTHAGQGCAITTRLLLPRSRYAEGVELAEEGVRGRQLRRSHAGPEPDGPARQRAAARARARLHREGEGGRCAPPRGRRPPRRICRRATSCEPTLFVDVDPDSTIAQEEIFGPVLAVIPYEDDDDAVRIANHSKYGLSGAVTSASLERADRVAKRIRTGTRQRERRHVVRPGHALRRLQAERARPRARRRGLRGVPRDQDAGSAGELRRGRRAARPSCRRRVEPRLLGGGPRRRAALPGLQRVRRAPAPAVAGVPLLPLRGPRDARRRSDRRRRRRHRQPPAVGRALRAAVRRSRRSRSTRIRASA